MNSYWEDYFCATYVVSAEIWSNKNISSNVIVENTELNVYVGLKNAIDERYLQTACKWQLLKSLNVY